MEFGNLNDRIYILIPIFIFFLMGYGMNKRKNILKKLGFIEKKFIEIIKIFGMTLGSLFIVISLLSPQKLKESEKIEVEGANLYVLIDISRSMMAKDSYPNRLEGAKRSIKEVLAGLKGDRIGFIPFSDSAYIQMPLTDDYFMANSYIDVIDGELISGGGTELLEGLQLAEKSFEENGTKEKNILIVSDGGDYSEEVIKFIKDNGIKIYSLGIGTEEGSVIPGENGFIKDDNGNVVISKLNGIFLKKLSESTGGTYSEISNLKDGVPNLLKDIKGLSRKNTREEEVKIYEKYYQYPLILGIILILIGYFTRGKIREEMYD